MWLSIKKRARRQGFMVGFASIFLLLASSHARVVAWGQGGHKIVALIAAARLDADTDAEVRRLLGGSANVSTASKMAHVANWADTIFDTRGDTRRWHYVNIPRNASGYDASLHCQQVVEDGEETGDCIVEAIRRNRAILADAGNSNAARAEALKFIIHFVGDIHQPLHAGFPADEGGNLIFVRFFNTPMKLHRVWDSGIIGEAHLSERHYADSLLAAVSAANLTLLQGGNVVEWAEQSWRLSKSNAYVIPSNKRLETPYYNRNRRVVNDRLTQAGFRLAKVLEEDLP